MSIKSPEEKVKDSTCTKLHLKGVTVVDIDLFRTVWLATQNVGFETLRLLGVTSNLAKKAWRIPLSRKVYSLYLLPRFVHVNGHKSEVKKAMSFCNIEYYKILVKTKQKWSVIIFTVFFPDIIWTNLTDQILTGWFLQQAKRETFTTMYVAAQRDEASFVQKFAQQMLKSLIEKVHNQAKALLNTGN